MRASLPLGTAATHKSSGAEDKRRSQVGTGDMSHGYHSDVALTRQAGCETGKLVSDFSGKVCGTAPLSRVFELVSVPAARPRRGLDERLPSCPQLTRYTA